MLIKAIPDKVYRAAVNFPYLIIAFQLNTEIYFQLFVHSLDSSAELSLVRAE